MRLDDIAAVRPEMMKRLEHFRNFTMAHPRLAQARDELMDAIDGAAPGSLVFVLGPTGVGKTTLRMKIEDLLVHQMAQALAADPGRLPFVSVEVVPPDSGRFRWRDYFRRVLAAMNEPPIGFKIPRGACAAPLADAPPRFLATPNWDSQSSRHYVTGVLPWFLSTRRNTWPELLPVGAYLTSWM